jgi:four helix bundle protein
MRVADYRELRAYKLAFGSAMEVFKLSRTWPSEERYSLIDQIRRSSRSVCANIAEAWRKRRYEAAFASQWSDSDTEAAETEVHLDFALRCGSLPPETHARLLDHYDHLCRPLTKMMSDAGSWRGNKNELREIPPEYFVEREEREERVQREPRQCLEASAAVHPPEAKHTPHAPRSTRSTRS